MKKILAACLLIAASLSASATTFSTDASDLWWNPNESGWGLNIVQQDDVLFATLYVYGPDGQPTWYVSDGLTYTSDDLDGGLVFTGPWYRTTGPWFGGPFNPAAVDFRQVGTASFTLRTVSSARFTYSVDNVVVTKNLERQTWRTNPIAGSYLGGVIGTYSQCGDGDGYFEGSANFTVTQSADAVTIQESGDGYTCTYSGTYFQRGRMGSIGSGVVSCSDGASGTFTAHEIEANIAGFTGHVNLNLGNCRFTGRIGGLVRD